MRVCGFDKQWGVLWSRKDNRVFRLIAHRGASAEAPENTRAAFEIASGYGATEVETDVRLTRDGQLVLFHDANLQAKVYRSGSTEDFDLADLEAMDVGVWFDLEGRRDINLTELGWAERPEAVFSPEHILGFESYLDEFGAAFHHHIEIKGSMSGLAEAVLQAVKVRDMCSVCTFTSFNLTQLERVRALNNTVALGWLCPQPSGAPLALVDAVQTCVDRGFQQCNFRVESLTSSHVRAVHNAGLELRVFGVNRPEQLRQAIELGADGATINWFRSGLRVVIETLGELDTRSTVPV